MAVLVTRRERFSAGHRLYNPSFSDEKNAEVFGKCSNPTGHGHNYTVEVSVRGAIDETTGYVLDLRRLGALMRRLVIEDVDHRNLNTDVSWLAGRIPTTEVLAAAIWDRLEEHLPPGSLACVRVWETDKNWAERRRDG